MMLQALVKIESTLKIIESELLSNLRLRRMVWLIGLILVCYVILGLHEFNVSLGERSIAMQSEISRIMRGAEVSSEEWWGRLEDEKRVQDHLIRSCWVAKDSRLASADMQTTLQQLSTAYDLKNSKLSLSNPEDLQLDEARNAWLIRAQVRGRIPQPRLPSLVNALENSETRFFVSEMRFVEQRKSGTLDLTLSACFIEGKLDE